MNAPDFAAHRAMLEDEEAGPSVKLPPSWRPGQPESYLVNPANIALKTQLRGSLWGAGSSAVLAGKPPSGPAVLHRFEPGLGQRGELASIVLCTAPAATRS
jgi:hypothetical protein